MSDFTPWLGLCHIRQIDDNASGAIPTLVAVWADSIEGFEREVHFHTNTHGLQMIGTEEVLPAPDWLAKHPDRKDGQRLAGKVSAKHPVALGALGGRETGAGVGGETEGEGYLHIEEIEIANSPDQNHLPFWEQDWITPDLEELLFGKNQKDENNRPLRTYFIVDATLRKNITSVFDLDTLDVPVRCLFKGGAAETMKEAAPYLLDVTMPRNGKISAFHQDFFANHWGQNTGIFIRTTASMDEIWAHFRRFTKVQVEGVDGWHFFRFWDPRIAGVYFAGIGNWYDRVCRWFSPDNISGHLQFFIEQKQGASCLVITLSEMFEKDANRPICAFNITTRELRIFETYMATQFIDKISIEAAKIWPEQRKLYATKKAWRSYLSSLVQDAQSKGLSLDVDIRDYIAITLEKSKGFWARADVEKIIGNSNLNTASLKIMAVKNKLETGELV